MAYDMSQDELHMYEKLYELMGARVRLTSDHTVYQGIVGIIIPGLRMVSLRHTSLINGEYLGIARFRFREITSLTVVESGEIVNRYPRNDYLLDILKRKTGQKYSINDVLYDGQLSEVSDDETSVGEELKEEEFTLELPLHLKNRLPNDFFLIDSTDINFTQAVQDISKQSVIGVSFDGPHVSRFGTLTSLCVSTALHIYLFDIEKLKNEAFDNGLRDIFEDSFITKVIHDCRFPSDCLAHQYSTQLTNVFDTQVADFIVSMQCYNDKYEFKYVSPLDCCLRNHLDVPPEFLHKRVTNVTHIGKNDYFTKRPISNEYKYDLIKNVLYLILLQEILAKKLLDPLHKNVSVYLKVLANATEEEIDTLGSELSPPDSIPPSILMYGIQTARFHKLEKKSSVSLECKFIDPKTEQIIELEKTLHAEGTLKKYMNSKSVKKTVNKVNKENCMLQKKSEHQHNNPSTTSAENIPNPLEITSETVDSIILKPSYRHIDEVYHKLVNKLSSHSCLTESAINAKPSANYMSKLTFRKPYSDYDIVNVDIPKEFSGHHDMNSISENSCTEKNASAQNLLNSNDFEAKLWALSDAQPITLSLKEKHKNIQFVPA